jgi:ribosomal protein S4
LSKRAFKHFYNFSTEKQFLSVLTQCLKKNNPENALIEKLESRLEVVLFRRSICSSIFESRQIILHGKIEICQSNDLSFQVVKRPTFELIPGDFIRLPKKINVLRYDKKNNCSTFFISERLFCFIEKPNIKNTAFPFIVDFHQIFD